MVLSGSQGRVDHKAKPWDIEMNQRLALSRSLSVRPSSVEEQAATLRRHRQFTQTYPQLREALTPEFRNHLKFPASNPLLLGIGATRRACSRHLRLSPNPSDDHLDRQRP